jgi:hypothetical protein
MTAMAYTITFKQNDAVIEHYVFETLNPDDYSTVVDNAFKAFFKTHADVPLFDHVTVIFDKDLPTGTPGP